jgi:hypothetical protein
MDHRHAAPRVPAPADGLYDPAVAEPPQGPDDARMLISRLQALAVAQPEHAGVCRDLIGKLQGALHDAPPFWMGASA